MANTDPIEHQKPQFESQSEPGMIGANAWGTSNPDPDQPKRKSNQNLLNDMFGDKAESE